MTIYTHPDLDCLNVKDGHAQETKRRMDVYLDGLKRKLTAMEDQYGRAVERDEPDAYLDKLIIDGLKQELCDYGQHFPVEVTTGSAHFSPEMGYWDNYQDHLVCSNCGKGL